MFPPLFYIYVFVCFPCFISFYVVDVFCLFAVLMHINYIVLFVSSFCVFYVVVVFFLNEDKASLPYYPQRWRHYPNMARCQADFRVVRGQKAHLSSWLCPGTPRFVCVCWLREPFHLGVKERCRSLVTSSTCGFGGPCVAPFRFGEVWLQMETYCGWTVVPFRTTWKQWVEAIVWYLRWGIESFHGFLGWCGAWISQPSTVGKPQNVPRFPCGSQRKGQKGTGSEKLWCILLGC